MSVRKITNLSTNTFWMKSAISANTNNSTLVDRKLWKYSDRGDSKSQKNDLSSGSQDVERTNQGIITHPCVTSSRQLNSNNSIDNEMTHFKPIRLMPTSGRIAIQKILKIPSVKYTNSKEKSSSFSPAKSKFKPEVKFKCRRSAFCLVLKNHKSNRKSNSQFQSTKASLNKRTKNTRNNTIINNGMTIATLNGNNNHLMAESPKNVRLRQRRNTTKTMVARETNSCEMEKNYLTNCQMVDSEIGDTLGKNPNTRRYYLRTRSKPLSYFPQAKFRAPKISAKTTTTKNGRKKQCQSKQEKV